MNPRPIAIVLAVGAFAVGAAPLGHPSARRQQNPPVFSTHSELVVLHVTVREKNGSFVPDLPQASFSVAEDSQPQTIQLFDKQDAPVTVGLLIDSSGSMRPSRARVIAAATTFAETSNPEDEMFALAFNDTVTPVLSSDDPFTSSPDALRAAMTSAISAIGRTALYDAIAAGLSYVSKGSHERKVLVVVSDGGDNASTATFDGILRRAQASNTVIYTVALTDQFDTDANPRRLKAIADASGGEAFTPADISHVEEVLRRVAKDIRNSYTLGYVSTNEVRDGRFRRVRVIAKSPEGRTLVVRTRQGYISDPR